MRVATAWQALAQNPFRFLVSPWPWRSLLYLLSGGVFGLTIFAVLAAATVLGVIFFVLIAGVVVLLLIVLSGIFIARVERFRLRLVDLDGCPDPHRPPLDPGAWPWLRTRFTEPATWRELGFTALSVTALCWLDITVLGFAFAVPYLSFRAPVGDPSAWPWLVIGAVTLAAGPYLVTAWAGAHAALTRIFLSPRDHEIGTGLSEVARTKERLLDAFESERARIERDLHDGAQQRLVTLGMNLGLARLDTADPLLADRLSDAQEQLTVALSELRDLVRGLNPQVLYDNGLAAAVVDTAGRSVVATTVDVRLPERLPHRVETTAYFVVAEALTNISKHSRASAATVYGRLHADTLVFEISDNGGGGADPLSGTGLTGLADRLEVVAGTLKLSSPLGGPTTLKVEIPCRIA
ncbi:sensor domain-containing protein [Rhodococcus sp. G-MC3]|uniref:sensor histidine kinase n=1 Tax=Rhodococcus sp. G-MC3 TaxID=3046209 RepID=UPI0024BB39D1|nr:sensor histidine kinase [Rhodococcus sp. G-MC3]MDJ0393458.1 sensor domain-containing protein [Rhodococcus sp. G-MC3]